MSKEFSATKKNKLGTITPILIIGPNEEGRNEAIITSIKNEFSYNNSGVGAQPQELNINLKDAKLGSDEFTLFAGFTLADKLVSDVLKMAKLHEVTIVKFDAVDKYTRGVLLDLHSKFSALQATNVVTVFSCEVIPEHFAKSPTMLSQLQVVEFKLPNNIPVLAGPQTIEGSPIHEYRDMLNDLSLTFSLTDGRRGIDSELHEMQLMSSELVVHNLEALNNLSEALKSIDGGVYGKNAMDRGMDISVVNAVRNFVDKFKFSSESRFSELAAKFESSIDVDVKGKLIERTVSVWGLEPDEPSLS